MVSIVADPTPADRPAIEEVPPGSLAAESATVVPAAAPVPAQRRSLPGWLPLAASGLAGFAALISAIGLTVASRTTAEARHAIEELAAQQKRYFAHAPAAPAAPAASHGSPAAAAHPAPAAEGHGGEDPADGHAQAPEGTTAPVSQAQAIADIRQSLIDLRSDLARTQAGSLGLADAVRDGQTEIANRVGAISLKVDRIDRALERPTTVARRSID